MMNGLMDRQPYRDPQDIIVIAPDFNYEADYGVSPADAFWNRSKPWGDWRAGAHSAPHSGHNQPVSSYTVLDTFMLLLNDTKLFPRMNEIALVGHSAGGQARARARACACASACASV